MILRKLEVLTAFIIGGHNLKNVRYRDDTSLMADSEEKLQAFLDNIVNESEKKVLSINCN